MIAANHDFCNLNLGYLARIQINFLPGKSLLMLCQLNDVRSGENENDYKNEVESYDH